MRVWFRRVVPLGKHGCTFWQEKNTFCDCCFVSMARRSGLCVCGFDAWCSEASTDAHFGRKKGTPSVTTVLLLRQKGEGCACVVLRRGVLLWNSNW